MFENLITYPIESPLLAWESKVVVRDEDRTPRLYVQLKLTGTIFPVFDSIPFVRIGKVRARFVDISEDRLSIRAYFDEAVPSRGRVEFGVHDQVLLRFPKMFQNRQVTRLEEERLPRELRYQERLLS